MGERDLEILLGNMAPELRGIFVFCSVDEQIFASLPVRPLGFFEEREGITVIMSQVDADRCQLAVNFVAALITLGVHSDLEAVGFLAFVCAELAKADISTNVISATYHDHIFVPCGAAERALALLENLSRQHAQS